MKQFFIASLLATLFGAISMSAFANWRWVDENGIVHDGERPIHYTYPANPFGPTVDQTGKPRSGAEPQAQAPAAPKVLPWPTAESETQAAQPQQAVAAKPQGPARELPWPLIMPEDILPPVEPRQTEQPNTARAEPPREFPWPTEVAAGGSAQQIAAYPVRSDKPVIMYATRWCPVCAKARNYFQRNGIPYTEYDIESNPGARDRWAEYEAGGVPVILIGEAGIIGFDAERFDELYQQ